MLDDEFKGKDKKIPLYITVSKFVLMNDVKLW